MKATFTLFILFLLSAMCLYCAGDSSFVPAMSLVFALVGVFSILMFGMIVSIIVEMRNDNRY